MTNDYCMTLFYVCFPFLFLSVSSFSGSFDYSGKHIIFSSEVTELNGCIHSVSNIVIDGLL